MGYKPIKDYDFKSAPTNITVVKIDMADRAEFHEDRWDKRDQKGQNFGVLINGTLLCYHRQYMDQSYLKPTLLRFTKKEAWDTLDMFMRLNFPFPYKVNEFNYDGFGGQVKKTVIMPYTARFKQWSGDPGVAIMSCSDGKERLIPTFAIPFSHATLPNDLSRAEGSGGVQFFGNASKSD